MTQPDIFDDEAPWAERLPELRLLLEAYSAVPRAERFTDTPSLPSRAMRSYLRIAVLYPGRAFRATAEILDSLKRGLDSPEVAAELATMPPMVVPDGRTREECLTVMVPHLVAFTEAGERAVPAPPDTSWEWQERLPNLSTLLGGYYHQDARDDHPGPDGTVDDESVLADYFSGTSAPEVAATVSEIGELLDLDFDEQQLEAAAHELGTGLLPPPSLTREAWLLAVSRNLQQRLNAADYQPPEGLNPAYPVHDRRSWDR